MSHTLVIVESPTKAKTIAKFLGAKFRVESSMGHVRDLPKSTMGVDIESGTFEPQYVIPPTKKKRVAELKKLAKDADDILLATDEDREGEAISWHLADLLGIKPEAVKRLVFHEITKTAIDAALTHPRPLQKHLVDAQQARRVLDRLVGYELSPLLWKKVRYGLSAGRVQSVAVHLIVEREKQRAAFCSAAYYNLIAELRIKEQTFAAELITYNNKPIPSGKDFDTTTGLLKTPALFSLLNQKEAEIMVTTLQKERPWTVTKIEAVPYQTHPYPPFITSTLQQEGSRKLGWSAKYTMRTAQSLYETGYITYMRTDSVTLSDQAIRAAREAAQEFGSEYLAPEAKQFRGSSKLAQEAHEAIRPAGEHFRHPSEVAREVSKDESALYELIWKRTVATQMKSAAMVRMMVEITVDGAVFAAKGKRIEFAGYLRAYVEGADDPEAELDDQEVHLPPLQQNQTVEPVAIRAAQHETQPPARYTEASLIKTLEAEGVGRPSTYATILDTIVEREYVVKEAKALIPTFTAMIVDAYLQHRFHQLVDVHFTARMEDDLDRIASGEASWQPYIHTFYFGNDTPGLHPTVETATREQDYPSITLGETEDKEPVIIKSGKYGPYVQWGKDLTASIPSYLAPAEMTLDKAKELITQSSAGPQLLGLHPENQLPVTYRTGRYGPYLQIGEDESDHKAPKISLTYGPKRLPVSPRINPNQLTWQEALQVITLPRTLGELGGEAVVTHVGRFGPYVKKGDDFRSLHKDQDVLTITLAEAQALLSEEKRGRRRMTSRVVKELGHDPSTGKPLQILEGRYGPYISNGTKIYASVPKDTDVNTITTEQALDRLKEKMERKKKKRKEK